MSAFHLSRDMSYLQFSAMMMEAPTPKTKASLIKLAPLSMALNMALTSTASSPYQPMWWLLFFTWHHSRDGWFLSCTPKSSFSMSSRVDVISRGRSTDGLEYIIPNSMHGQWWWIYLSNADTELFKSRMLLGLHLDGISHGFGQSPNQKKKIVSNNGTIVMSGSYLIKREPSLIVLIEWMGKGFVLWGEEERKDKVGLRPSIQIYPLFWNADTERASDRRRRVSIVWKCERSWTHRRLPIVHSVGDPSLSRIRKFDLVPALWVARWPLHLIGDGPFQKDFWAAECQKMSQNLTLLAFLNIFFSSLLFHLFLQQLSNVWYFSSYFGRSKRCCLSWSSWKLGAIATSWSGK